jgi:hypothetical protein
MKHPFAARSTEKLVRLSVPQSSVGAPLPAILADERTLFVCYLLQHAEPGWDGASIRLVDNDAADEPVAVLKVRLCRAHTFGPPNEEAIGGQGYRRPPSGEART